MEFSLLRDLGILGTGFAIAAGFIGLFWKADEALSGPAREALGRWLQRLPVSADPNWPQVFAGMFDRIFGKRHLSWRCFFLSCLASLIAVGVLTLVWFTLRPEAVPRILVQAVFLLAIALCFNLLADYVSLLETRYVIRWMSGGRSVRQLLALMALDAVITAMIFLLYVPVGVTLFIYGVLLILYPANLIDFPLATLDIIYGTTVDF